jgi:hypothetical protein
MWVVGRLTVVLQQRLLLFVVRVTVGRGREEEVWNIEN